MESANFGAVSVASPSGLYQQCFGNMPDQSTYIWHQPVKESESLSKKSIDIRTNQIPSGVTGGMEMKALFVDSNLFATSTNYSGTSGSVPALVPIWWDTGIIDQVIKKTPLWGGLIKHISNKGLFADWTNQSARSAGAFKTEGAALTTGDSTWTHYSKPIKYAYVTRELSGPILAGSADWVNAMTMLATDAYQAMAELLETQICQGTTGGDSGGFSGFLNLVTTNYTNRSSAIIRLSDLDTALDTLKASYPGANPNLMVTDPYTFTAIANLLYPYQVFNGGTSIAFGIESISYRGVPIITSNGMPTTTNSREVHVYDTNVVEMRVLLEPTMMPLAIDRDSYKFTVKCYLTMVVKAEVFNYRIYGVT